MWVIWDSGALRDFGCSTVPAGVAIEGHDILVDVALHHGLLNV